MTTSLLLCHPDMAVGLSRPVPWPLPKGFDSSINRQKIINLFIKILFASDGMQSIGDVELVKRLNFILLEDDISQLYRFTNTLSLLLSSLN